MRRAYAGADIEGADIEDAGVGRARVMAHARETRQNATE